MKVFDKEGSSHPITVFGNFKKNVTAIRCNSDERWLLTSGEDGCLRVWDIRQNKSSQLKFQFPSSQNSCCILPNDDHVISCGSDGFVNMWDLRANKTHSLSTLKDVSLNSVCVDNYMNVLAAVNSRGSCFLWHIPGTFLKDQAESFALKHIFQPHNKYGLYCVFSPDSMLLATCSADKTIKVWKTAEFSLVSTLTAPKQGWVWACAFSEDSQYLITVSSDSVARLWHIEKEKIIREFHGHQNPITAMDFSDEAE